ncbi:MAG: hypothetical protein V7607_5618 [Solirubrobacteraceae bacterium]
MTAMVRVVDRPEQPHVPKSGWTRERLEHQSSPVGVTAYRLEGGSDGARLLVLAGVHGDEPSGVAAALRVMREVGELVAGSFTIVPVCNELAWGVATRESPDDGENLARVFLTGRATQTAKIADVIAERLIHDATAMVDLHTASTPNDMVVLAGYATGTATEDRSAVLAEAFGAPFIWRHPTVSPGRTLSAAVEAGVPAIYVEGPGGGSVDHELVDHYVEGVHRILRHLGMTDGPLAPAVRPCVLVGDGNLDHVGVPAGAAGLLIRRVDVGEAVDVGQPLVEVHSHLDGGVTEAIAPSAGRVVSLARERSVATQERIAVVVSEGRSPDPEVPAL